MSPPKAVLDQILHLIRRTYGDSAELVEVERPGDWQVARVQFVADGGPAPVVAKWLRSNPERWRTDPRQMITEVAGLRFAEDLAPGLAPRVIAAEFDPGSGGVVLLEDLGPREPLDAIIRRDGVATTTRARLRYAQALGRLAASTAGREQDWFRRLVDAPAPTATDRLRVLGPSWAEHRRLLEDFGVGIPAAAETEMARLQALLTEPGPFLALSNGDMGENNFMIDICDPGDHGRLIDFEFAHFDHALAHAANFFVPGPRWLVVADPIADRLEVEFRTALATGIPEAADDEPYRTGIAAGCVAMGFERCGNLITMDGRPPGHPSRVQRIATLEAAAAAAEARDRWPALTDLLRDLARTLRHRWPDADVDLSALEPYTPRSV